MANGALPNPASTRHGASSIPTTRLSASGRTDPAPVIPEWMNLGSAATAWWEWAWKRPQACAWTESDAPVVARRALLEDELAAADDATHAARLSIMRMMTVLDEQLGLSPKALAALRWTIVDDAPAAASTAVVTSMAARRARVADAS